MTDNLQIDNLLRIVAPYAIFKWAESEMISVAEIQACGKIDEEIFRRWKRQWGLNQIRVDSEKAVECLNRIRKEIVDAQRCCLPGIIHREVDPKEEGCCELGQRQTSLLSKFAFSLRSEIAVPYDRYARKGLCKVSGVKNKYLEHQFPRYLEEFDRFAKQCGERLNNTEQTKDLGPFWSPIMSQTLFERRTADKLLMFLGMLMDRKADDQRIMKLLQEWIMPSCLMGIYRLKSKGRRKIESNPGGIENDLAGLCNKSPDLKKHLDSIGTWLEHALEMAGPA